MARTISAKEYDSALFNLDSLRTKLLNELYETGNDELRDQLNEVEDLLSDLYFGRISTKKWARAQELVMVRKTQRYMTCINSGMDERLAAGAFSD